MAREFVTVLKYLIDKKVYAVPEDQAIKVAEKVSFGCSGAAKDLLRQQSYLLQQGLIQSQQLKMELSLLIKLKLTHKTFNIFLDKLSQRST